MNLLTQTFMCKELIKDPVFGENFIKKESPNLFMAILLPSIKI